MLLSHGVPQTRRASRQVNSRRSGVVGQARASHVRVCAKRGGSGQDGGGPDDNAPEKVDIDQLAERLSKEAEKLRLRGEEDNGTESSNENENGLISHSEAKSQVDDLDENGASRDTSPFKPQVRDVEAILLEDVGEGGFCADEFELIQQLGYLTIQAFQPRGSILENSQVTKEKKAVIAFVARYYSGRPYEFPVTTLLKEYLPVAEEAARNELLIMMELCGLPEPKWENLQISKTSPPVVRLLGYFLAAPSESATKSTLDPEDIAVTDTKGRSVWLVYRWEKLKPLSGFWEFDQAESQPTWPWQKPKETITDMRKTMLRSIFSGILDALDYCHSRNVVHGSLGSGSVFLSTYDARDSKDLAVKLDNFGFATFIDCSTQNANPGSSLDGGNNDSFAYSSDLKAAGLLMFETAILSLTDKANLQNVSPETIERLVMDVFREDFAGLREYCENEADWSETVSFLESGGGSGWDLLKKLLEGRVTAAESAKSEFFGKS
ncbi:hypothetical protein BSKO_04285 [Bryopsis sp. KO-2023]|nr:hypothetical protein BSKO_04285 [Bryopsis sp. KO-2023]